MRMSLDVMGGDNAPHETTRGVIEAAREYGVEAPT
jgi:fatty acid/phospholipid biosynthesis enzyme